MVTSSLKLAADFFTLCISSDMNGKQLADAALLLRPELRVLFTSGYAEDAIVHRGWLDYGLNLLGKASEGANRTFSVPRSQPSCIAAANGDTVEFARHDLGRVSRDGSVWRNLAVQTDRFGYQVPRASTPCCP